jgi:TolB-like protein/DNA-binding SARP family transcriptional activator
LNNRSFRREQICDLLWNLSDDPRGSLRWSLSKIRRLVDDQDVRRIVADRTNVGFNDSNTTIDVNQLLQAAVDVASLSQEDLESSVARFGGQLLQDLELVDLHEFNAWCVAWREQVTQARVKLLEALIERTPDDPERVLPHARLLVGLLPFDQKAHITLIRLLRSLGRVDEAEQQYQYGKQMLKEVGADSAALYQVWRVAGELGRIGRRPLINRPSLAVLPFVNMSKDIDQEYFADGITDDIITGLAKCSFFSVVSRNSTFAYKGRPMPIPKIAGELGARYVLEGSVRRAGGRVRVTAQLIDAVLDNHIWAERFDRDLKDVFEIQDEITNQIVQTIAPEYMSAEKARVAQKSDRNLDAWDHYVRAYWHFNCFTKTDMEAAVVECEKAIELEPDASTYLGLLALVHTLRSFYGFCESRGRTMKLARQCAEKSVQLNKRDPLAQRAIGSVEMYERNTDQAIAHFQHAIALDPHEAENYGLLGYAFGLAGNYEKALEHVELAIIMSPRDAYIVSWYNCLAASAVAVGRFAEGESWSRKAILENPEFPGGHRSLAAALGHLGKLEEARCEVVKLKALQPKASLTQLQESLPFTTSELLQRYLGGLSKAGLK